MVQMRFGLSLAPRNPCHSTLPYFLPKITPICLALCHSQDVVSLFLFDLGGNLLREVLPLSSPICR